MQIASVRINGFRGLDGAEFLLHPQSVFVGPNGCGKSSLIDALSLVLGKPKLVRPLTEHDFTGSSPSAVDRIRIVATLTGFPSEDPDQHGDWFRMSRAVPKWLDQAGRLVSSPGNGRKLAAQIGFAARFDHTELVVETIRYFHDDDDMLDPFSDDGPVEAVPIRLLNDIGYFVLPARRTWEGMASFGSELFRRVISDAAGIPAGEILQQRDALRNPASPLEESPALSAFVARLNENLAGLMLHSPRFALRVTAGDSEAVLQSLVAHFTTGQATLPASRQGMGMVAVQSLLLLLELGRSRKASGLSFILALEEPELHLAPGTQVRLVADAVQNSDQTICVTHSPRVAAMFAPTDVFVVSRSGSSSSAKAFLTAPLAANATNNERKLYLQNRVRVVEALMHPFVLVPEGRFDAEWLLRLADVAEAQCTPPFRTVYGVVPTENGSVCFTASAIRAIRDGVVALVDGDAAGDRYVADLLQLPAGPHAVLQWPEGWAIEDAIGWIIAADPVSALARVRDSLTPEWPIEGLPDLLSYLETRNDASAHVVGLKEDVLAHEAITSALSECPQCVSRAALLLDALVHVAVERDHPLVRLQQSTGDVRHYRFQPV